MPFWLRGWSVVWNAAQPILHQANFSACQLAGFRAIDRSMIVALVNSKGGVGKSTLAVHLAVWLFDRGVRVALLDVDKQRSSSQWLAEAEPGISIEVADTPEEAVLRARGLRESHDLVVADGPAGVDEISRTLLILADLALFPISPSILDLRSVTQATAVLKFAHSINQGRPEGRLILNRMRRHDVVSRELMAAAPGLGLTVCNAVIHDLRAYVDAAQQGTVTSRMRWRARVAAAEIDALASEVFDGVVSRDHALAAENG